LETSSLDGEIIQISAVTVNCDGDQRMFDQYVLPVHGIDCGATAVNSITKVENELFYKGILVPSVDINTALKRFLGWLKSLPRKVVLIAHNAKAFDMRLIWANIERNNQTADYKAVLCGYIDTLPL